jgi:regulator of replication initiation timing
MNTFKRALLEVCEQRNLELQEVFEKIPVFKKIFEEDKESADALLDFISYLFEENRKLKTEIKELKKRKCLQSRKSKRKQTNGV